MKRVVCLAGVGGVGKSSIVDAIERDMPDVKIVRSQSRKAYTRTNTTEKAALAQTEEERKAFQADIWLNYKLEWMQRTATDTPAPAVTLFERSPYDYVAYQISVLPSLSLKEISDLLVEADKLLQTPGVSLTVLYVPFPVPWGDGNSPSDSTRHAPSGKNYVWDSLIRRLMMGSTWSHPLHEVTIEDRVKRLKEWLDPEARSGTGRLQWMHFCTQL